MTNVGLSLLHRLCDLEPHISNCVPDYAIGKPNHLLTQSRLAAHTIHVTNYCVAIDTASCSVGIIAFADGILQSSLASLLGDSHDCCVNAGVWWPMIPPLMKKPRGKDAPAKPIKHAGTQRVHAERKPPAMM